jgi:hypothetical protein
LRAGAVGDDAADRHTVVDGPSLNRLTDDGDGARNLVSENNRTVRR